MIRPGASVLVGAQIYEVVDFVNSSTTLLVDETGKTVEKPIHELRPIPGRHPKRVVDLASIDPVAWGEAVALSKLLDLVGEASTTSARTVEVSRIAKLYRVHVSTVYRWFDKYRDTKSVSSLLRKPRKDLGRTRLSEDVEKVIDEVIKTHYLTEQRKSIASVASEIKNRCKKLKLEVPDRATVRNRILRIEPKVVMEGRYGKKMASEHFDPLRGSFPNADFPFAAVQIDHTPVDVVIVDDKYRKSIKRPNLTLAFDVDSKMVPGFYMSLDPPGALSTGQCLLHTMLDKRKWLASIGLEDYEWPCQGKMRMVHCDNAKEFRGKMLGWACKEHGILLENRPKGAPRYGGHIERSFRTFMKRVHEDLPGTTFQNTAYRFDYDSEGRAVMTLAALEMWFTMYLLGVYHQKQHAGNDGLPPIVAWKRRYLEASDDGPAIGVPFAIEDEERLRLDFLPYFKGTVQQYGIQKWNITWYSDSIRRFMLLRDPKNIKWSRSFICRYDPRDVSELHLYDPETRTYISVPYRDLTRQPASLWEVKQAIEHLKEDASKSVNEELIFRTIDRMRKLVEQEAEKTKKARRTLQQQRGWEKAQKANADRKKAGASSKPNPGTRNSEPSDDPDLPPEIFDDIRES